MENKRIGFTCSTFDLLHSGHVLMLQEAKTQCDYLIVGLQVDPTMDRAYKNKPVQSVSERYLQLAACKYVDEIIPYTTEQELIELLQALPIDVRILGEEYRNNRFTGDHLDIECYFNKRRHKFSTTELRKRVYERELEGQNKSE